MKNSITHILFSVLFVLGCYSVFSQPYEWKHYEYKDINLKFDLPADFVFEYPSDGSLSFIGYNDLVIFSFKRVDKPLYTVEQRKAELYLQGGFTGDYSQDGNFKAGTHSNGYLMIGTASTNESTNEDFVVMMLSDPDNPSLNFLISTSYGGEGNADSPAYEQAGKIILSFGPISK